MHEVLVNRLGGLSLPRKSVVRLTDRPDMTLDVYRGRKTTMQQQQLLNVNNHNLKNVLLVNSLKNIIIEPTRGCALLDPVITSFDQTILDSGVLNIPPNISDHSATYITIPFDYSLHTTFKRKIWLYKRANYIDLGIKTNNCDWDCLNTLPLNQAVEFFTKSFLNLVRQCIPSKEITVRSDDIYRGTTMNSVNGLEKEID